MSLSSCWDERAFFLSLLMGSCRCRYQKLSPSTPKLVDMPMGSSTDPVEMVTVPALGPEWGREEMQDMTKSARKAKKAESRREKFKAWRRDERGICGKYFTRKSLVFFVFGLCAVWVSCFRLIFFVLISTGQRRHHPRVHDSPRAGLYIRPCRPSPGSGGFVQQVYPNILQPRSRKFLLPRLCLP